MARALYHKPEIILLDEATTGLDASTQKSILTTLRSVLGETTVVIVSHDDDIVALCDRRKRDRANGTRLTKHLGTKQRRIEECG